MKEVSYLEISLIPPIPYQGRRCSWLTVFEVSVAHVLS